MSQNGKGSKRRPRSITQKAWETNYERIFKKSMHKPSKDKK